MTPENSERLKRIAELAVIPVLGPLSVKNVYVHGQIQHVSYWEASRSLIIDLLNDSQEKAIRLSGVVLHGKTRNEILDVVLDEREYTENEVERLEQAFLLSKTKPE